MSSSSYRTEFSIRINSEIHQYSNNKINCPDGVIQELQTKKISIYNKITVLKNTTTLEYL